MESSKCSVSICPRDSKIEGHCLVHRRQMLKHGKIVREEIRYKTKKLPEEEYTYTSYRAMRQRCSERNSDFKYYKDRGVCERWSSLNGWVNFLQDMGLRPKGLTLERVDNEKGYSPDNCKWATRKEQGLNTRKVYCQKHMDIKLACQLFGIKFHSVEENAKRNNSSYESAFERVLSNKAKANKWI